MAEISKAHVCAIIGRLRSCKVKSDKSNIRMGCKLDDRRFFVGYLIKIMLLAVLEIGLGQSGPVAHAASQSLPTDFAVGSHEGQVKLKTVFINEKDMYQIILDAKQEENEYPFVFISQFGSWDWSNFGGITCHMENRGENPITVNLTVETENESKAMNSGNLALFDTGEQVYYKAEKPYGSSMILAGFSGDVYLPFNLEQDEDALSQIKLFGLTFGIQKGETAELVVGDFALMDTRKALALNHALSLEIVGENSIFIPFLKGSASLSKYKLLDDRGMVQNDVEISLNVPYEGVSAVHGELRVNAGTKEGEVELDSYVGTDRQMVKVMKMVQIVESPTSTWAASDENAVLVPHPDEFVGVESVDFLNRWLRPDRLILIRAASGGIATGILLLCIVWLGTGQKSKES
ncbi:hypothetical protein LQZ18_02050 [Lachnospiraceae bacterium ZAX-1]